MRPPLFAIASLSLALVMAMTAAAPGTYAAWTDQAAVATPSTGLVALKVPSPTLACTDLGASVAISWPVQTTPTTLAYTATVGDGATSVSAPVVVVGGTATTTVTTSLLSTLLGTTMTVRVVAQLPGTSWTAAPATINVRVVALGVDIGCL